MNVLKNISKITKKGIDKTKYIIYNVITNTNKQQRGTNNE